jgi:hypothetical protein
MRRSLLKPSILRTEKWKDVITAKKGVMEIPHVSAYYQVTDHQKHIRKYKDKGQGGILYIV